MAKRPIRERVKSLVGTRQFVCLSRPFPGDSSCYGFVVGLSEEWVHIFQLRDFAPDGYSVLRVVEITEVRTGKYERQWKRMLASEGIVDQVGISDDVDLQNTGSLLESLQRFGRNIIVECEDREDSDADEFYIGQIVKVDDGSLWFVHFDALGKWEEEGTMIPLDEITRIQFDTPYVNIFSKYVPAIRPRLHE